MNRNRKKIFVKKGDEVVVISGKEKGKKGVIKIVLPKDRMVIVSGINFVKRAVKPEHNNNQNFLRHEKPIHLSNVKLANTSKKKETDKNANIRSKKKSVK